MTAPRFWTTGGLPARLLAPLGQVGAAVTARRMRQPGWRAPVPVICVGNATVGGSGKTPVALDICTRLLARGVAVHALTRGYGGSLRGPVRIDQARHSAAQAGDEALLLAAIVPCWVGADRAASARAAIAEGAAALVMDDGLQNPGLAKDLSLLVIDGGAGFGNAHVLPAGPLRETVAAAASRCQLAVMIGADRTEAASMLPPDLPVAQARLAPGPAMLALSGQTVFAFAGIGRPQKFFATLRDAGLTLAGTSAFADHHPYSTAELARLRAEAAGHTLVTTSKDFVRLPVSERHDIRPMGVRLAWANEATIESHLARAVPA